MKTLMSCAVILTLPVNDGATRMGAVFVSLLYATGLILMTLSIFFCVSSKMPTLPIVKLVADLMVQYLFSDVLLTTLEWSFVLNNARPTK